MSWEDQGRQQYGWFGHGTAPTKPGGASDTDLFGPDGRAQRIRAVAYGAVAALPPAMRSQAAAQNDSGGLDRLTSVMTAWSQAARLDDNTFAAHFLGRAGDDPVAGKLREAVLAINLARSHDELRQGGNAWRRRSRLSASTAGHASWPRRRRTPAIPPRSRRSRRAGNRQPTVNVCA
jgi:hypothetical protein